MKVKSALTRIIVFVLLVVITILVVDYYVDAYASFRLTYDKIGKMAVDSNYCVGEEIPLSERKAKWGKLNYINRVEYLIMGSSRSMMFSKENLGLDSFYNLSVSGGSSVNDYLAETYILYHNNILPDYLLIEISPCIFNANAGENRWTEWGDSTNYMEQIIEGKSVNKDDSHLLRTQFKDIIAPSYFKYNLEQLKEGKRTFVLLNEAVDNEYLSTQHVDGSYAYSRIYQKQNDVNEISNVIESICESNSIYYCSGFEEIDMESVSRFCKLVDFLESRGVKVSIYLPPYAAPMYEYIQGAENYKTILDVEEWVLTYGVENNIQVYGSYNPENCDLELTDLYDEYHIKDYKVKDTLWPRNENLPSEWLK